MNNAQITSAILNIIANNSHAVSLIRDILDLSTNSLSIVYTIDDIKEVDKSLSDNEALEVMQRLKDTFDMNNGVSWDIIKACID